MTHPSDGSFCLLRLSPQNQGEQEISGVTKGTYKVNKCRICCLSLYFMCIYYNLVSWPSVIYYGLLCRNINQLKGRHAWNVCPNFHIFLRMLPHWLVSFALHLGASGKWEPKSPSLKLILFCESHQGPDCACSTKA